MSDITQIFNQVRNIPYSIPTSLLEKDCCCSGKHRIIKKLLEELGYKARYRVVSFKWSSMDLPKILLDVPHEDLTSHVYLEFFIKNKWVDIDITWDPGLKSIFTVNQWDGKNNTIAVPFIKKFSLKQSQEIMKNENEEEILKDLKINGKFYQRFNNWLENIRKEK